MKIFIKIIFLISISNSVFSNETEVIDLHETKSLDQMVLDQLDNDDQLDNNIDLIEETSDEISLSEESTQDNQNIQEESVTEENLIDQDGFWNLITSQQLSIYLNNSNNIKSEIIQNEVNNFFEYINLDYSIKKNRDIFYEIINYFYSIGDISKAYNLLQTRDLEDDENRNFYITIEINYLLSTYKLENACSLKNDYTSKLKLKNFLIEKLDIFCSILENNFLEGELLNSILIESEINNDEIFQDLYSYITSDESVNNSIKINFNKISDFDLIYLYSAMARIGELPLDENFLKVDSKNLSIPIILNKSSPIDLRIMAANESYINQSISIESLAALYQSVDFDSNQFDDPEKTIITLSGRNDILMAYYYQLLNVQIFPTERLQALINFWEFAKIHNLEDIAYALSYKIVQSVDFSADNINYSPEIATSYIYNNDYENALKWITLYESTNEPDEKISYAKILLNLHSTEDINNFINLISINFENLASVNVKENEELIYVLLYILKENENLVLDENFESIYDDRLMPSLFITEKIKNSIEKNNDNEFLIYTIISLNNKSWKEIHPNHLKLILTGFIKYNNGELVKDIIIEIFKDYKII